MSKFGAIFFLLAGFLMMLFSGFYGLSLGGIFREPAVQGFVGGLIPTIFAAFGSLIFLQGWNYLSPTNEN